MLTLDNKEIGVDKCSKCDNEANHSGMCDKCYLEMVGGSADEYKIQSIIAQIKAIPWAPWVKWVAMDSNGDWYAYEGLPTIANDWTWENPEYPYEHDDEEVTIIKLPAFPDWTQSLIKVKE